MTVCKTCHGKGTIPSPNGQLLQTCPMCGGSGEEFDPGLFFVYELGPIVLIALQVSLSNFVQILDRDFKWQFAAATSTGAFTVLIKDAMNKRPFSNQPIHNQNIFGTAQNPMPLLAPYMFRKRGSILCDLVDLSGAGNTIRLSFIGIELSN